MQKTFLIVDDDERFAALMAKKLGKYARCIVTNSGEDALLHFEHCLKDEIPLAVVFMDIDMPDMSGHEVVRTMRAMEAETGIKPANEFKLVMITAHKDVKNVRKSFFKGGADAYVTKDSIGKIDAELVNMNVI